MSKTTTFGVAVVLATFVAMPLLAQTPHGAPDPALMAAQLTNGMLLIRTHHSSLHDGNVITYMRLRGKVPPSSPSPMSQE